MYLDPIVRITAPSQNVICCFGEQREAGQPAAAEQPAFAHGEGGAGAPQSCFSQTLGLTLQRACWSRTESQANPRDKGSARRNRVLTRVCVCDGGGSLHHACAAQHTAGDRARGFLRDTAHVFRDLAGWPAAPGCVSTALWGTWGTG